MVGETMELKELILSTLEELDEKIKEDGYKETKLSQTLSHVSLVNHTSDDSDERAFLLDSKERLEVLFEGLKSEQNQKPEEKLNLVINFLQFYLTEIDKRLSSS
jgi:hypothetical protein